MPLDPKQQPPYYKPGSVIPTTSRKIYVAKISQSGTSNPTAQILENTLGGTPTLTRTGTGRYELTLTGLIPKTTTFILGGTQYDGTGALAIPITNSSSIPGWIAIYQQTDDTIKIATDNVSFTPTDISALFGTSPINIKFEVY